MTYNADSELERDLAALTRWNGPDAGLWRAAIAAEPMPGTMARRLRLRRFFTQHVWNRFVVAAAAAILLIAVLPMLYQAGLPNAYRREAAIRAPASVSAGLPGETNTSVSADEVGRYYVGTEIAMPSLAVSGDGGGRFRGAAPSATTPEQTVAPIPVDADRQVIRKATIELVTKDVRTAFLKAAQLISEAQGEYVQQSGLTGDEKQLAGNLTLRVAADRLSAVLQQLRELGEVRTESSTGEDVTAQVVDIEARLSNEKRVEVELLQLLEKRTDAPLKEVLELRQAIAGVRQTIESLTGQRERLGRLVSLATVLVILRASDAPTIEPGLLDYFGRAIADAAARGARVLVNTLAGLVVVLIGGAFWIVLIGIPVIVWLVRRRKAA
ncbi:MAG: DUF4349 domain-containing protein [Planctomycetes bacterium]|nr:DUF4349 domain-containing protein [Planctomycetota bacterium]